MACGGALWRRGLGGSIRLNSNEKPFNWPPTWARRPPSRRFQENDRLRKKIVEIHAESDGVYGSPKVRDELLLLGFEAEKHRVARLMREIGLKGCPKKRYRVTTQSDHGFRTALNSLDRQFTADGPNPAPGL